MEFCVKIDPATWQQYISTPVKGKALLLDPFINKGTAFTARERDELDLDGLLPPVDLHDRSSSSRASTRTSSAKPTPLEKFIYLASLHDRNETLFYRLVLEHIDEMMPIVYTPVVGEACQKYSHIYRRGRGLYISYDQRDRIERHPPQLPHQRTRRSSSSPTASGSSGLATRAPAAWGSRSASSASTRSARASRPTTRCRSRSTSGPTTRSGSRTRSTSACARSGSAASEYQAFIDSFVAAVQKVYPERPAAVGGLPQGERDQAARPVPRPALHVQRRHPGHGGGRRLRHLRRAADHRPADARPAARLRGRRRVGSRHRRTLRLGAAWRTDSRREEANKRIWTVDTQGAVRQ